MNNFGIVILYSGNEMSEYGLQKIGEILKEYADRNKKPLIAVLNENEIATKIVQSVRIAELKEQAVDTSVADGAIILLGTKFADVIKNAPLLAVNITASVTSRHEEDVIQAVKALSCGEYPHSDAVARRYGFTKAAFDTINHIGKFI